MLNCDIIIPTMPEHPTEPILEAILLNQDKNAKDVINTLELMIEHADINKVDSILEAQLVLTHDGTKEIVQAIKDIPKTEIPEQKEVDLKETNKLLRELTDEVKKKEEYEIEIDSDLRQKLKGDKGDNGKDGINGKDGLNGTKGDAGPAGPQGKDGKQGPQGIPGKSLTDEDIDRIAKGLKKTKKENFFFANSGVNEVVAGNGVTIDNSNPQHPIISTSGGSSNTFEAVLRNLNSYPVTFTYVDGKSDTVSYTTDTGTITETVSYSGNKISSIVLTGDTPSGIDLTKTFNYTGGRITSFTYS